MRRTLTLFIFTCVVFDLLVTSSFAAPARSRTRSYELPPARSDQAVANSIKDVEKSYAEYFKATQANPNMSKAERQALRKQIIGPAASRRNEAIAAQTKELKQRDSRSNPKQKPKSKEERDKAKAKRVAAHQKFRECKKDPTKCKNEGAKAPTKTNSSPANGRGTPDTSGPTRPEVTLDGSGIQKEIQFEKKQKSKGPMELPEWKPSDGDINEVTGSKPMAPKK